MATDIALIKHLLAVLASLQGSSLPEDTLAAEVEIRAGRPLTTQQVGDAMLMCLDRGWVNTRKDDFGRSLYWITDTGQNKRSSL